MPSRAPRVLALSSHFIPKLTGGGLSYEFGAVSKWTARTPLLDYDKLLFPVCVTRAHWTLVLANLTRQQLEVLDSSNDASLVNYLVHPVRRLLHDEVSARPHKRFSTAVMDWPVVRCDADSALAQCHDDCGVFVMRAAVLRTLDLTLDFGASDLRIVRERIAFELLHDALDICVLDLQVRAPVSFSLLFPYLCSRARQAPRRYRRPRSELFLLSHPRCSAFYFQFLSLIIDYLIVPFVLTLPPQYNCFCTSP